MTPDDALFDQHRERIFAIAYRMLGSVTDAEDVVQDAFVRWSDATPDAIRNPAAYLTSIVTRLCIDHLRSARVQRAHYVGPWLPEPLFATPDAGPDRHAELSDSLSMAFLLLLEQLSPMERAVFLLHEVFDYSYLEIADLVDKRPDNCRQIARRARQRLHGRDARFTSSHAEHERLMQQFVEACRTGDLDALLRLLADDAVMYSDGGGKVLAARKPLQGAARIAHFFQALLRKTPPGLALQPVQVNGRPGVAACVDGQPESVLTLDVVGGVIRNIYIVRNPDKLGGVPGVHG